MKEHVAEIVAAYVAHNAIAPEQLPALIASVSGALSGLDQSAPLETAAVLVPAVPIRRSIGPNSITCLECGRSGKTLKRHLMAAHATNPKQYRERWNLPQDYPMVAPSYAARRSELARTIGLGTRRAGGTARVARSA